MFFAVQDLGEILEHETELRELELFSGIVTQGAYAITGSYEFDR